MCMYVTMTTDTAGPMTAGDDPISRVCVCVCVCCVCMLRMWYLFLLATACSSCVRHSIHLLRTPAGTTVITIYIAAEDFHIYYAASNKCFWFYIYVNIFWFPLLNERMNCIWRDQFQHGCSSSLTAATMYQVPVILLCYGALVTRE